MPGTARRKRWLARSAATNRDGATSVDAIELETSCTSMTEPWVTGTAALRCGRAAATISAAMASRKTSIGAWRRQRGRRGATEGCSGVVAKFVAARSRPRWETM